MFLGGERRGFTGRPDRDDAVGALVNLPLDKFLKRLLLDPASREWRDERGNRTAEQGNTPGYAIPAVPVAVASIETPGAKVRVPSANMSRAPPR